MEPAVTTILKRCGVNQNQPTLPVPDLRHYAENRAKFPPDELAKYAGKCVAFSADGTRIVASGDDFLTLWNEMKASGVDPSQFVWSDVPPPEEDTQL
jgi:hypothetical protein